jgi:hypothetical protein
MIGPESDMIRTLIASRPVRQEITQVTGAEGEIIIFQPIRIRREAPKPDTSGQLVSPVRIYQISHSE